MTGIDRRAVVDRHRIRYTQPHLEAPLTVGNGEFAFTADITGLQTFAELHEVAAGRQAGIPVMPLGTQAQWGYHWGPNPEGWTLDDTMETHASPRGPVRYPTGYDYNENREQSRASGRAAGWYFWANPRRLHLARIGLRLSNNRRRAEITDITGAEQDLDLWSGILTSRFRFAGEPVHVRTSAHPTRDAIAVVVESPLLADGRAGIEVAFPYVEESFEAPPVWDRPEAHRTEVRFTAETVEWDRQVDGSHYQVRADGLGLARVRSIDEHTYAIDANGGHRLAAVIEFSPRLDKPPLANADSVFESAALHWAYFWESGAAVDFAACADSRATELERRVVLSQYQTAVNCAGSTPPQETGLVCNSWGGTFHLEMHWWHAAHFAAWGRPELLERSLGWYGSILDVARRTARDQGFEGARWPKHVGPEGIETPNVIGPLLLWQQPHPIHFAELLYWVTGEHDRILGEFGELVDESAGFLASFALRDVDGSWHLPPPLVPAQERYELDETWDPTFEVAYARWGLLTAQAWRERRGLPRRESWDAVAAGLRPPISPDGRYDAVQRPARTDYTDHPSMLAALGAVPDTGAIDHAAMMYTLDSVLDRWDWPSTWGWDFPMMAMTATRLGNPGLALDLLLRPEQKNTYLPNGHNAQVQNSLPLYLPGNGGLLMAVALLAGGWIEDGEHRSVELPEGWRFAAEGFPSRP